VILKYHFCENSPDYNIEKEIVREGAAGESRPAAPWVFRRIVPVKMKTAGTQALDRPMQEFPFLFPIPYNRQCNAASGYTSMGY